MTINLSKFISFFSLILLPILLSLFTPYLSSIFKDKKEIQYEIISESKIDDLKTSTKNWPGFQIVFGDEKIDQGGFIVIRIKNTGEIPILPEDFRKPISILFGTESKIIGFRKVQSTPNHLEIENQISGPSANVSPLLLNPGDSFIVEFFVKGDSAPVSIGSRIVGISEIKKNETDSASGLYIGLMSNDGNLHAPILHINRYISFPFACALLATSFFSMARRFETHVNHYSEMILSLTSYLVGLFTLTVTIVSFGLSVGIRLSLIIGTLLTVLVCVVAIRNQQKKARDSR